MTVLRAPSTAVLYGTPSGVAYTPGPNLMADIAAGDVTFATEAGWAVSPLASSVLTQTYTANATWTKPANAQSVRVILIGAGGGGGGGGGSSISTQASGAGGLGGGGVVYVITTF